MGRHTKIIWAVLLTVYMAAVAYLCFMKPEDMPEIRPDLWGIPIDKVAHFAMFFPFPALAYATFRPVGHRKLRHFLILAVVTAAGSGLAMGTEHLQGLLEYRSYEVKDFYADALGIGCSAALTTVYILIKKH